MKSMSHDNATPFLFGSNAVWADVEIQSAPTLSRGHNYRGETRVQKELQPGAAEAETKVRQLRTCAAHASSKPHSPARLVCNVLYSILLAEWFCKPLMTNFKL
jgi:hypothetical protein